MATTRKVLGQAAPDAITETALYTVPALTTAVISSFTVCNRSSTAVAAFRISVSVGGGATANKDYIYYDVQLAANDTFVATMGVTLGAGDIVRVYYSSDTATSVTFQAFGAENS